jgi:hypothetical protein
MGQHTILEDTDMKPPKSKQNKTNLFKIKPGYKTGSKSNLK